MDWKMILSELITQFLRILMPVAIALILKWASELWLKFREKNPDLADLIAYAGRVGYAAAEEYAEKVDGISSEQKMIYALGRANEYLKTFGLNIDIDVIKDAIIQYGVNECQFSWTQKPLLELFEETGAEKEAENEPAE